MDGVRRTLFCELTLDSERLFKWSCFVVIRVSLVLDIIYSDVTIC